jgi:glycosyltransferase involved in cell wall biosynthesis
VCWFVASVLPLVRAQIPDATLAIVGSHPTERVRALVGSAVTLHANVSDAELLAWYERARAAVVPLRCGAGVKLKVVEALREGLPLVTTPIGAQGLPGLASVVAVEATPSAIAEALCALLLDDVLWRHQAAAQIRYARTHFGTAALARSLQACGLLPAAALPVAA